MGNLLLMPSWFHTLGKDMLILNNWIFDVDGAFNSRLTACICAWGVPDEYKICAVKL